MTINARNEGVCKLVKELIKQAWGSLAQAVKGVRQHLARIPRPHRAGLADRLLEIGKDCAPHLKEPFRSVDYCDLFYDEKGLPR